MVPGGGAVGGNLPVEESNGTVEGLKVATGSGSISGAYSGVADLFGSLRTEFGKFVSTSMDVQHLADGSVGLPASLTTQDGSSLGLVGHSENDMMEFGPDDSGTKPPRRSEVSEYSFNTSDFYNEVLSNTIQSGVVDVSGTPRSHPPASHSVVQGAFNGSPPQLGPEIQQMPIPIGKNPQAFTHNRGC